MSPSRKDQRPIPGPGLQSAIRLWQGQIERLKAELEIVKCSDHPGRDARIRDLVSRIDERQGAIDSLQSNQHDI